LASHLFLLKYRFYNFIKRSFQHTKKYIPNKNRMKFGSAGGTPDANFLAVVFRASTAALVVVMHKSDVKTFN
jgi:hypothetical protein